MGTIKKSREELHRTFGGLVYASDYEEEYYGDRVTMSRWSSRIAKDERFDKSCKKWSEKQCAMYV